MMKPCNSKDGSLGSSCADSADKRRGSRESFRNARISDPSHRGNGVVVVNKVYVVCRRQLAIRSVLYTEA